MSRNCSKCGDTTCNCAIIEGPGIGVTGTGSGASPYIVEADIVHVDTPTVDLSGNGGSTPLSAVVNPCGLTDNLNEIPSGSLLVKGTDPDCLAVLDPGVAGQAVISNGTGFVLGDAAAPGVMNYCDSVTGDPTGYGVIDSALGVEKYYDLNGIVVALRPASWEPCCCDGGGFVPALLNLVGGAPVFIDSGTITPDIVLRSSPIGNLAITNPSTAHAIEIIYANQYVKWLEAINPRGAVVDFNPLLDPGSGVLTAEILKIGAGIRTSQITGTGFIFAGSGGPGSTQALNVDSAIGVPTSITILPGATLTIRYQITMQGGSATNGAGSIRSIGYVFPRIFSQRFIS